MSTIPEAAVEAAAKAVAETGVNCGHCRCGYPHCVDCERACEDAARAAIEAARPSASFLLQELASLWELACESLNLDTDASAGEWQTSFDKKIADYHQAGYEAGQSDARQQIAEEILRSVARIVEGNQE